MLRAQDIAALGANRIKKRSRHGWVSKSGKITLSAKDWRHLVEDVKFRSGGRCENTLPDGTRCPRKARDPHHLQYRSQGGSDTRENVFGACEICHDLEHLKKQKFIPWTETESYDA